MTEFKLFIIHFCVSGSAAAISKTLVAPLERTKLILQNQESSLQVIKGEIHRYSGIIDCLTRLPREQGILSYWRGNGANVTRYIPLQALNFSLFAFFNSLFRKHSNNKYLNSFAAGAVAGLVSITVVFPLDLCTTRLAVDVGSDKKMKVRGPQREFYGLRDCIYTISGSEGIRGLYRGFISSAIGLTMYRCLYFGLYESFKTNYENKLIDHSINKKFNLMYRMLAAQVITTFSAWVVYPFDTAGRRMMLDASRPKELKKIDNLPHAFSSIYKTEGITGFYKGALANIMRATGGALVLVLYDEILYYTGLDDIVKSKTFQKVRYDSFYCK